MQFKPDIPEPAATAAPQKPPLVHRDRIAFGMAAAAAAFFMLSTMSMFAKLLSPTHTALEIAFYRNTIAAIPFAIWFFFLGRRDLLKVNSRVDTLVLRSIIGTISIVATFKAFNYLPLADAQALFFTSSLFVPIMGTLFLSERVGPYRWSAVAIGFLGMLVIVRPSGAVNLTGFLLAISAAMMHSILSTLLRILGRTERPETVTFYFLLIGSVLTGLAMPFMATTPTWHDVPLLLGAGISGALAQTLLSAAYKFAPMALVTIFNYLGIVWATAYGWFIWGDWPSPPVWIGAGIIIASSLFIVWRENKLAKLAKLLPPEPSVQS
jgi:drug/metabolite transporter (DMT)-like permease